jgi:hypothetical protein
MRQIRDQWLVASIGDFGGFVPVKLEEALSTDEGKTLVRAATVSLLDALSQAPSVIHRNILDLLLDSSIVWRGYGFDIETRCLIDVGNAFLNLLDGKINSKAGDGAPMPGST